MQVLSFPYASHVKLSEVFMGIALLLRLPILLLFALTLLCGAPATAQDDFPDAKFWKYRLEDVEGIATLDITNRKLKIAMPGRTKGFGNYETGTLRIAGEGRDGESKSTGSFFQWSDRYGDGVCSLNLDGLRLRIEDQGTTVHVGGRKFKVDGKQPVKLTIPRKGKITVEPKEAEIAEKKK